jgi:TRAP-type C4-dicarboxylate transport system permease small subunit
MRGRVIERVSVAADKVYGATRWLTRWLLWVGVVAVVAVVIITSIDAVLYKTGGKPFLWAYDTICYFILISLSAAGSVTLINDRHANVDVLVAKFPKRAQAVAESVVSLLSLSVSVAAVWYSILYGLAVLKEGNYSYTTLIPWYPFHFIVAAGFVPIAVLFLLRTVKAIRSFRTVSK